MATKGYFDTVLNTLPEELRYPLRSAFYYLADNFRFGTGTHAENGQWYRVTATTPAVAGTEFVITHGIGSIPTQLVPLLDLSRVNGQLVPLQVTRIADANHIYLKSTSTSAGFTALLEI